MEISLLEVADLVGDRAISWVLVLSARVAGSGSSSVRVLPLQFIKVFNRFAYGLVAVVSNKNIKQVNVDIDYIGVQK